MAAADPHRPAGGDGAGEIGLGLATASTSARPRASPAAMAEDRVQPAAGRFGLSIRAAAKAVDAGGRDQDVDGLRPVGMAALHQHRLRAEGEQAPAWSAIAASSAAISAPSRVAASARLGVEAGGEQAG